MRLSRDWATWVLRLVAALYLLLSTVSWRWVIARVIEWALATILLSALANGVWHMLEGL